MTIRIELDDQQSQRLIELAAGLKIEPTELAKAAILNLLSRHSNEFQSAAKRVLEKNRDLYHRLS